MKKFFAILLLIIYSAATLGVGVKEFYCCGKLVSKTFSLVETSSKKSCATEETPDCCKTKFKSAKVKDSHIAAADIDFAAKHFTGLHEFASPMQVAVLTIRQLSFASASHSPPAQADSHIYLLNCVFRI